MARRDNYPEPTNEHPTYEEIAEMVLGDDCWDTDGCSIEPDGVCHHGYPSWLIQLGLV